MKGLSMSEAVTVTYAFHIQRHGRGRKVLRAGQPPSPGLVEPGRVPRVAKLMALAIRYDGLVRAGAVKNYSDLAGLGHVTRARMSQVMGLLNLCPRLQEELLFLPRVECGRSPVILRDVLPIAQVPDWKKQHQLWSGLLRERNQFAHPCPVPLKGNRGQ